MNIRFWPAALLGLSLALALLPGCAMFSHDIPPAPPAPVAEMSAPAERPSETTVAARAPTVTPAAPAPTPKPAPVAVASAAAPSKPTPAPAPAPASPPATPVSLKPTPAAVPATSPAVFAPGKELVQVLLVSGVFDRNIGHKPVVQVREVANQSKQAFETQAIASQIATQLNATGKVVVNSKSAAAPVPDYVVFSQILPATTGDGFLFQIRVADPAGNVLWRSQKTFGK